MLQAIQERADSDLSKSRNIYEPLLNTEDTFVKDINNFLSHRKLTQQRKKEILHKKWNDRVYEPMATQIEGIMQGYVCFKICKKVRSTKYVATGMA